jgi:hypothetical protein
MENLPAYTSITFILTTILSIFIFYKAAKNSKIVLIILCAWLVLQAALSLKGFYTIANTVPPRFMLLLLPPLIFIIILFFTESGKIFLDNLNIKTLTIFHIVRIPVELVLFWLFIYKKIPVIMTFEGRNFDILSGITAPFIFYFGFIKKNIGTKIILAWNIICLLLVFNIVAIAVLSAPFPFQKFGFDQPNIALLYFPFIWLPCCVVPLAILAHTAAIRKLINK